VVGDADRQLPSFVQAGDGGVAGREVLEAAGRVDERGQPEPVELAQEVLGGRLLAIGVEDRGFGDR
jgi:hypothetical protein